MKRYLVLLLIIWTSFCSEVGFAQEEEMFGNSKISGNFQIDMQSYSKDTIIGAKDVDEKVRSNGFLWLTYTSNNFNAGMRYENYLNPILGIPEAYKGNGIAFRYAEFTSETIDVTAGNFYEQFGSGMIFRTYQEYALGYDNAMDGLRVKFRPISGLEFKGMVGKQRKYWSVGEGIVRGADMNLNLNDALDDLFFEDYQVTIGTGIVSKYQLDRNDDYELPQNALLWSGRLNLTGSFFNLDGEYGYKTADPSLTNKWDYTPGQALLINTSFFGEGMGLSLNFHRNDNMDVRSDRNETGSVLLLNFLPPLTKQHTYSLAAMYPYATQLNGEIGFQIEGTYTIPKNTFFEGDYATTINVNYSQVNSLVKNVIYSELMDSVLIPMEYESPFFEFGDKLFYREFALELNKKISKDLKTVITYLNQTYNIGVSEHEGSLLYGNAFANILIADFTYKLSSEYAIRTELQHLWANQDTVNADDENYIYRNGDWLSMLLEFTVSPTWYFSIADQWNYGNENDDYKIHYLTGAITYVHDATRVSIGYGKQREGIICVGGVCRPVPASNGFFLNISSSF